MICRYRKFLVLALALILGLTMGLPSVQASQLADLQTTGSGMNMPADCPFCDRRGDGINSDPCLATCANILAALLSTDDTIAVSPSERIGGSRYFLAIDRAGRPDPHPPKI